MPEVLFRDLKSFLSNAEKTRAVPVYLLHGEEVLYKTALDAVLNVLLSGSERAVDYTPVDNDDMYEAIERVNTYSLLSKVKVVGLPESRVFCAKGNDQDLLEKAKAAFEAGEMKKAGRLFSVLLGLNTLSLEDVSEPAALKKHLKPDSEIAGDGRWLEELVRYCIEASVVPSSPRDGAGDLQRAVEKGFPPANHLMITADIVDKRRGLYKTIRDKGMIVDCSVPKGSRKADLAAQEALMTERAKSILSERGKTLDTPAFQAVREMTGFDLRTFSVNLEKLADFTGNRPRITVDDVRSVLNRTKVDPIYELTGALSDRNLHGALFFLRSLISENLFPLQILAAMTNQVRKLLLAKGFTESAEGRTWTKGIPYPLFQDRVLPAIRQYDRNIEERIEQWTDLPSSNEGKRASSKKVSKSMPADIHVADSAKSPYPVYLTLLKSDRFTRSELIEILETLSEADLRMKTTGQNPVRVLEAVVIRICRSATNDPR